MKSIPEIFLGKAQANWSVGDYWAIRFTLGVLGFIIWCIFATCMEILANGRLGLSQISLLFFLGFVYSTMLIIVACWKIPTPKDLTREFKEKVSSEIKKATRKLQPSKIEDVQP